MDRDAELDRFERLLLRKKKVLLGDLSHMEEEALRAGEGEVSVDHMADYGTDSFEQDLTIGIIENEEETIRLIDLALQRIRAGTFGNCERCDAPIPRARLRILPYARYCMECQKKAERAA